jgi:dienelactone hydrolase
MKRLRHNNPKVPMPVGRSSRLASGGIIAAVWMTSIFGIGLTACTSSPRELSTTHASPVTIQTQALKPPEVITLKTQDGWTLIGDLYVPLTASKGGIVLLHQRGGSAQDWQPLAMSLQQAGFTALAIDQRGAGRSTQGPGASGNDAPWLTIEDIAAAIAKLSSQPLGLIGASYGANNALIYAAAHPDQIRGVALLSPGANYNGLDAIAATRLYRGTLMIYHSRNDSIAGNGPDQINQLSSAVQHRLQIVDGSAHGTELLNAVITHDVVNFFQVSLRH